MNNGNLWGCTNELRWLKVVVKGQTLMSKANPMDTYHVSDIQKQYCNKNGSTILMMLSGAMYQQ